MVSASLLINSSNLMLANSPLLLAKNPWEGNPSFIHQESVSAIIVVSAFLVDFSMPWMNRVKESIIQRMYLQPSSLGSSVTTSLRDHDFGNINFGPAIDLLHFWQTLWSLTAQCIIFRSSGDILPVFLYAAISWSFYLWQLFSWTFLMTLKEQSFPFYLQER